MIPLNATAVTTAHAQHQHEAATRTPHQLADADTDAECKPITATGCLDPSLVDMYSVFGASARTDTSARPPRRPALSVQTVAHCLCGEELCGFDCHFLQQEFQEFAAAELRRRRHRRHRRRQDQSKELTTNSAAVGGSDADSESNCSSDDCDCENDGDDDALTDLERRFHRHYSDARSTVGFSTSFAAPALFGDAASVTGGDSCGDNGDDTLCPPARMNMRRSKSCGVHSSEFDQEQLVQRHNAYRLRIGYRDEALRERSERNTQALLQRAMVGGRGGTVSTATILARKALRYRKVLERMEGVDVTDPSLDVSKCLGVHWQRVGSPEQ